MLLREGNGSNCVERREDLGLFQEEQPSQMGTIFLVTESKRGIVREGPYQFRITLLSLLWGTVYLSGSAATLLTLGRKGGRAWPRAMFQQPSFSANNGQEWIFITDGFPGKLRGRYFILEMSLEILSEEKASRLRVTRGCITEQTSPPERQWRWQPLHLNSSEVCLSPCSHWAQQRARKETECSILTKISLRRAVSRKRVAFLHNKGTVF